MVAGSNESWSEVVGKAVAGVVGALSLLLELSAVRELAAVVLALDPGARCNSGKRCKQQRPRRQTI